MRNVACVWAVYVCLGGDDSQKHAKLSLDKYIKEESKLQSQSVHKMMAMKTIYQNLEDVAKALIWSKFKPKII